MDIAGAGLLQAIAAQADELDLRAAAVTIERPRQIGDEDEAALEQAQDQEILGQAAGDLGGELFDPGLDLLFAVQRDGRSHAVFLLPVSTDSA
jgi:hypothetical protein